MPVSFRFLDDDGNAVDLNKVDDEMRIMFGQPPSKDSFCPEYMAATDAFIAILAGQGGSHITARHMTYVEEKIGYDSDAYLMLDAIIQRWDFEAWR